MNVNQIETYYQQISSQGLAENSYFLMRLTHLWGEDCLELFEGQNSSCE
ncbi:MAG: hypothetical protein QNJ33_14120 [Crocosphaera sp.]|nr:hypothetical protein [Crocosphaera sp.]